MTLTWKGVKRFFFIVYLIVLHGALAYFVGERILSRYVSIPPLSVENVADPTAEIPVPTPIPIPSIFYNANVNVADNNPAVTGTSDPATLIVPVAGVKREALTDTFSDARSEGRIHNAIDIMAPQGTPVLAAADGEIVKFHDSVPGGITIYQLTRNQKYFLYYAHLQKRADNLKEGDSVTRGDVIGYVGDTGNAGVGNFHLHFSIALVTDPKRFWDGTNINPFPLLSTGSPLP